MEKIVESVYYDETSGPSLRLGGHIQPDYRQTVTLANTEYTSAGLNPMLRVLFQAEGSTLFQVQAVQGRGIGSSQSVN